MMNTSLVKLLMALCCSLRTSQGRLMTNELLSTSMEEVSVLQESPENPEILADQRGLLEILELKELLDRPEPPERLALMVPMDRLGPPDQMGPPVTTVPRATRETPERPGLMVLMEWMGPPGPRVSRAKQVLTVLLALPGRMEPKESKELPEPLEPPVRTAPMELTAMLPGHSSR